MHTNEEAQRGRRRRKHSDQFKAEAVEACSAPGVSMAAVALSYGVNANLLRRWVVARQGSSAAVPDAVRPAFVPLALPAPVSSESPGDIHIEVKRGATTIAIRWPVSSAQSCAAWLRELLR